MSTGQCFCACSLWEHPPSICTGTADTSRPLRPSLAGHTELPCCSACAQRITTPLSPSTIAPIGSGHTPDMPALTPAMLRSAGVNPPLPPRPPDREGGTQ